jgi:hypothetical protein
MAKTVYVEHPGQHNATEEQLQEAGVNLDNVVSYVNESGVGTEYTIDATAAKAQRKEAEEAAPADGIPK